MWQNNFKSQLTKLEGIYEFNCLFIWTGLLFM